MERKVSWFGGVLLLVMQEHIPYVASDQEWSAVLEYFGS